MLKKIFMALAVIASVAGACSGEMYHLKGEQTEPGVYNVLRRTVPFELVGGPTPTLMGVSRMADFREYFQKLVADNDLVFIGDIDSVIGDGMRDTIVPGLIPDIVLAPQYPLQTWGGYYARLKIDTVIKGSLPSAHFWFKGYGNGTSCDVSVQMYKWWGRFLNFSDKFEKMSDLKLSSYASFCSNCPQFHAFDGRFLYSPEFPVLTLDIREVLPGYPVALDRPRNSSIVPWKPGKKAYQPDGRTVPEAPKSGRKSAVPVLK